MSAEIWKDVVGYEGLYMVSNLGRIKSLERTVNTKRGAKRYKSKILTQTTAITGYLQVRFHNSDGGKTFLVHRIVAKSFLPNPSHLSIVNHKNGIKSDNALSNLEWVTYSQNLNHALQNGLNAKTKILSDSVREEIRNVYSSSKISQAKLADKYGVSQNTISKIVRGG